MEPPVHPGTVKMVNVFEKTSKIIPVSEFPKHKRFVYFKDGAVTDKADEATEAVPVVETRMLSTDAEGKLVSVKKAVKMRIEEFGPGGQPLRWTIMVK